MRDDHEPHSPGPGRSRDVPPEGDSIDNDDDTERRQDREENGAGARPVLSPSASFPLRCYVRKGETNSRSGVRNLFAFTQATAGLVPAVP